MCQQCPLYQIWQYFAPGNIDQVSRPSAQINQAVGQFHNVAGPKTSILQIWIRFRPVGFPNGVSTHLETACVVNRQLHAFHRRTRAGSVVARLFNGVVGNPAAFTGPVKIVDFKPWVANTACSSARESGAPAEMASRIFFGIEPAPCHALQSAGTAGRVMASAALAAWRTASGSAVSARMSGMPCNSSGRIRLENPYECATEITPRFGQSGRRPIVATMLSASAASCSARKATSLGAPVVAEVIFR